ncbi:hypothetical protein BDY24DRAFT_416356 [Mrakia frigida]|uniref:mitochondrial 37S ribosomal protein mS43 MRP1 n=1 Tax=Mrakia frigida TaxID=29902 RepID=UPI003FCC237D
MSASTLLQRLPRASSSSSRLLSGCSTRSFASSPSSSSIPPPAPINQSRSSQLSSIPDLKPTTRKLPKYYPWSIDPTLPVGDLFSTDGIKTVAVDYHQSLLAQLAMDAKGTEFETSSVLHIVENCAKDAVPDLEPVKRHPNDEYWRARRRRLFISACELLNNNFFLSTLRDPRKPGSYPYQLEKQVVASFGSSTGLEQTLLGTAEGMTTSGWLWLVQEERNSSDGLSLISVSGPGTLLVHKARPVASLPNLGLTSPDGYIYGEQHHASAVSNLLAQDVESRASLLNETSSLLPALPFSNAYSPTSMTNASPAPSFGDLVGFRRIVPLAVLSMNESAWMVDHGVWGKEEYVKAWLRAVDWEMVESRMFYTGGQEGKQILDTTVGKNWNQ